MNICRGVVIAGRSIKTAINDRRFALTGFFRRVGLSATSTFGPHLGPIVRDFGRGHSPLSSADNGIRQAGLHGEGLANGHGEPRNPHGVHAAGTPLELLAVIRGNAPFRTGQSPGQGVPLTREGLAVEFRLTIQSRRIETCRDQGRPVECTAPDGEPTVVEAVIIGVCDAVHFDGQRPQFGGRPSTARRGLVNLIPRRHPKTNGRPLDADHSLELGGLWRKQGIDVVGVQADGPIVVVELDVDRSNGEDAGVDTEIIIAAHGVRVVVRGRRVRTVRTGLEFTQGFIREHGVGVIVTCSGIATPHTAQVITVLLIRSRVRIIVARLGITAAVVCGTQVEAVAILISCRQVGIDVIAINRVVDIGLSEFGAVDVEGRSDDVGGVRASVAVIVDIPVARFGPITIPVDAVSDDVIRVAGIGDGAVVIAVAANFRIALLGAAELGRCGAIAVPVLVEIIGGQIQATDTLFLIASSTDGAIEHDEVVVVPIRENLHLKVAGDVSCGGELPEQNTPLGIGNTIGVPIEDVPCPSDVVVDGHVAARQTRSRVEVGEPSIGA